MERAARTRLRQEWRVRAAPVTTASPPPPPPLPPPGPRRAALVCTMAYNAGSLDSFVCYYIFLGFRTLYLYLDDARDASVGVARRYPADRVRVRVRDQSLRKEWESVPSWKRLAMYADTEVQARQALNCEHAIARCRAAGADGDEWLLHVDSDELLFLPGALDDTSAPAADAAGGALQRHLSELERLGAVLFTYRNLEGVPETLECEDDDPYRSVSLFKQHPSQLARETPSVERAVRYWTSASDAGGELFRFYANGKSIIRVCDVFTTCGSVHEWDLPSKAVAASSSFTNNPELLHTQYVYHQLMRVAEAGGAVLLHFAVCSFATFWRKRWAALGYASPNHRFRGGGGGLDLRSNALSSQNRRDEAEALYRRSMMVETDAELDRQLAAGVCVRLRVTGLIDAARAAVLPAASAAGAALAHAQPTEGGAAAASSAAAAPPSWLSASALSAVASAERRTRRRAADAVAGDALLTEFVRLGVDEAAAHAHAMALDASDGDRGERNLEARGLSIRVDAATAAGDELRSRRYAACFELLLPRAARSTLQLLPMPRMRFDLSGYCNHPMAAQLLPAAAVGELVSTGRLLLPPFLPAELLSQLRDEVRALEAAALSDASTARLHERSGWLLVNEQPPMPTAPVPPPIGDHPPAELFGGTLEVEGSASPTLCSMLRLFRGLGATIENISELRLACPRAALLRHVMGGGSAAAGPPNSSWPDTGAEICCALFLGDGGGGGEAAVEVTTSEGRARPMRVPAGGALFTLARQTRVDLPPAPASAAAGPPSQLWLTFYAYSSMLRSSIDDRMLGVSAEARASLARVQQERRLDPSYDKGMLQPGA